MVGRYLEVIFRYGSGNRQPTYILKIGDIELNFDMDH